MHILKGSSSISADEACRMPPSGVLNGHPSSRFNDQVIDIAFDYVPKHFLEDHNHRPSLCSPDVF